MAKKNTLSYWVKKAKKVSFFTVIVLIFVLFNLCVGVWDTFMTDDNYTEEYFDNGGYAVEEGSSWDSLWNQAKEAEARSDKPIGITFDFVNVKQGELSSQAFAITNYDYDSDYNAVCFAVGIKCIEELTDGYCDRVMRENDVYVGGLDFTDSSGFTRSRFSWETY
ncbi:hypothetical protein ACFLZN_02085, partial [Nanoarchaeota archaeon]